MEEFLGWVNTYGLSLVLIAVLGPILYKFFMRVYEEQRDDRKQADEKYSQREQEFLIQLNNFNDTLNQVNETSREIAISNKMLVGSMKDDLADLKNDMKDIKEALDKKGNSHQSNPLF